MNEKEELKQSIFNFFEKQKYDKNEYDIQKLIILNL